MDEEEDKEDEMTEEEEEMAEKAYSHVGCYADSREDRVLGHLMKSPDMTTEVTKKIAPRAAGVPCVVSYVRIRTYTRDTCRTRRSLPCVCTLFFCLSVVHVACIKHRRLEA